MDHDYAKYAKIHCNAADSTDAELTDSGDAFPIEKARLRSALYLVILATVATVGYGCAVQYRVVRPHYDPRAYPAYTSLLTCLARLGPLDFASRIGFLHHRNVFGTLMTCLIRIYVHGLIMCCTLGVGNLAYGSDTRKLVDRGSISQHCEMCTGRYCLICTGYHDRSYGYWAVFHGVWVVERCLCVTSQ